MNTNFDNIGRLTLGDNCVKLKPYVNRAPIQYEIMTDAEITLWQGDVLVVDTESYKNYFLIAFKHLRTGKIIIFENSTEHDIHKLSWIMHSYQTIGFNS